jgi:hypothetical protein
VRVSGERLDVERLRVLPVDAIADAAKPPELAQALRRSWFVRHLRIVPRTGALGFALPRLALFSHWQGSCDEVRVAGGAAFASSRLNEASLKHGPRSTALTCAFGCYKLTLPAGAWIDADQRR